eukprot:3302604-Prymnesium_polylepis.1
MNCCVMYFGDIAGSASWIVLMSGMHRYSADVAGKWTTAMPARGAILRALAAAHPAVAGSNARPARTASRSSANLSMRGAHTKGSP